MEDTIKNGENILKKQKIVKYTSKTLIYIFLIVVAITTLFPFYWMINTSLKSNYDYRNQNPQTFLPSTWHFENYQLAFQNGFSEYLINTLIVGITSTILGLIFTILAAYAFARLHFKGKDFLFSAMLATMMIPGELFQITNFITVNQLQWTNSYIALIVPFLVSIFYIYLLRNNFKQIPTITSITILKLMGSWNSYIWPRLVNVTGPKMVTNWIMNAFKDANGETSIPMRMAGVVIVSLPLFLVFVFFRKYIMRGVSRSGTKG